jgi:Tol biopolymer transport system component
VTPDGRFLVFTSHRALTADDTRGDGPAQVYEYDAQTGTLTRVSIGQDGYNENG